jgi:hypothetical protein
MPFTFEAGFFVWHNSTPAANPVVYFKGNSKPATFFIIDGVAPLTLTAAAAALITLLF